VVGPECRGDLPTDRCDVLEQQGGAHPLGDRETQEKVDRLGRTEVDPALGPRARDAQSAAPASIRLDRHSGLPEHTQVPIDRAPADAQLVRELGRRDVVAGMEQTAQLVEPLEPRDAVAGHRTNVPWIGLFSNTLHPYPTLQEPMMQPLPLATQFTPARLRNRIRTHLDAPPSAVWALVGDLTRFPEYSAGLARVEVTVDADGRCAEYVCHFKPMADGEPGIVSRELIRWWDPPRGYASSGAGGDAFGLARDLNLVVLEPAGGGTRLTIDEHYDAVDLPMMKTHFDDALRDIGESLIARFGGRVVDRYLEP
jgi:carbon monoxide dehydrogenase subunit G